MIHRAVAGSLERFMAIITEHFAGAFPTWLAPVQVAVLPISDEHHGNYAQEITNALRDANIRVEAHYEGSLGKRIRTVKKMKVPYTIVVGDAEKNAQTITVEMRHDEKLEHITLAAFIERIKKECE